MQDQNGLFYYPDPNDKLTRMYVRRVDENVEFRMWHAKHPEIWEKHGWIPFDVIKRAALQRPETQEQHLGLYDLDVARALLREAERDRKR